MQRSHNQKELLSKDVLQGNVIIGLKMLFRYGLE